MSRSSKCEMWSCRRDSKYLIILNDLIEIVMCGECKREYELNREKKGKIKKIRELKKED